MGGHVLQTRDRARLGELARAELPGLYALARHLAGPEAEDLVQEALVRACGSIGRLRDTAAGGRWLRVILTNVWRDRQRKEGRVPDEVPVHDEEHVSLYRRLTDEDPFPYSDTMHIDFLGAFSRADVHHVLARLPMHYRVPLVLRYVEGFDTTEIADALDRSLGTVCSQLHRGRQQFEQEMWEYARESGLVPDHQAGTAAARSGR